MFLKNVSSTLSNMQPHLLIDQPNLQKTELFVMTGTHLLTGHYISAYLDNYVR